MRFRELAAEIRRLGDLIHTERNSGRVVEYARQIRQASREMRDIVREKRSHNADAGT